MVLWSINIELCLVLEVKYTQHLDPIFIELKESVLGKLNESFLQGGIRCLGIKIDCCQTWIMESELERHH